MPCILFVYLKRKRIQFFHKMICNAALLCIKEIVFKIYREESQHILLLQWTLKLDSIYLLFIRSSCTLIIKNSQEKSSKPIFFFKVDNLSKTLAFSCNYFVCFSSYLYCYSSWPSEMGIGKIQETSHQLSVASITLCS